jgi:hypothetical protein
MKKKFLAIFCAASFASLGMQSALAESVAVDGSAIFILDNSVIGSQVVVKNLTGGTANTCLSTAGSDLLNLDAGITATDIVIKNGTAVITTYNSTTKATDVKLVNVASCPVGTTSTGTTGGASTTGGTGSTDTTGTTDLSECYATLEGDKLHVPCFNLNGEIISIELGQRGKSMNFEYESYKPKKDHHKKDDHDKKDD